MAQNLKSGDKVWVFDWWNQRIEEITVQQVYILYDGRESLDLGNKTDHFLGFDCFPTREALCEHYMKIFE